MSCIKVCMVGGHAVWLNMANKNQFHFGLRAWIRLASLSS